MDDRPDRWVVKVLSVGCFDDQFRRAVLAAPLASLDFVYSVEAESEGQFAASIIAWAPAIDKDALAVFSQRALMLEQFWLLAKAAEMLFTESFTMQLGFGQCSKVRKRAHADALALRRQAAMKSLLAMPKSVPKPKLPTSATNSSTPLLDAEAAEKQRWAARLEAVAGRAGDHAELNKHEAGDETLTGPERERIKNLVLSSGAPKTMAVHVRRWEKLERWCSANSVTLYPLTIDAVVNRVVPRAHCHPVVAVGSEVGRFAAGNKASTPPGSGDGRLPEACQDDQGGDRHALRGRAGDGEVCVLREGAGSRSNLHLVVALLVFASLRFDDAIHVKPLELEMRPDVGLLGVAWQTKVERKRRGTKFIVPNVGFTDGQWLWVGWELFDVANVPERDFWVPDLNTVEVFNSFPPDYNRSVLWFRWLARDAFTKYGTIAPPKETSDKIKTFTMHSPRVTMLDAAVHQGRTPQEIGLQANWKDPGPMVLKYTRDRSTIPAVMMQQLVADLKDASNASPRTT